MKMKIPDQMKSPFIKNSNDIQPNCSIDGFWDVRQAVQPGKDLAEAEEEPQLFSKESKHPLLEQEEPRQAWEGASSSHACANG